MLSWPIRTFIGARNSASRPFTVIEESRVAERKIYEGMAPAIPFLAQGLGLSLHEEPFIAAHTDTLL
jgi:hypothetical protein